MAPPDKTLYTTPAPECIFGSKTPMSQPCVVSLHGYGVIHYWFPISHARTQAQRGDVIGPKSHNKSEVESGTQICLSPKSRTGLAQ